MISIFTNWDDIFTHNVSIIFKVFTLYNRGLCVLLKPMLKSYWYFSIYKYYFHCLCFNQEKKHHIWANTLTPYLQRETSLNTTRKTRLKDHYKNIFFSYTTWVVGKGSLADNHFCDICIIYIVFCIEMFCRTLSYSNMLNILLSTAQGTEPEYN